MMTKAPWKVGKTAKSVVAFPENVASPEEGQKPTGHHDYDHYGGYLIAESIHSKDDANLIAMAPELLERLETLTKFVESIEIGTIALDVAARFLVDECNKTICRAHGGAC